MLVLCTYVVSTIMHAALCTLFLHAIWLSSHAGCSSMCSCSFIGFIQIAITTIANLSSRAENSGQFFDVDQVC